ncbi:MAG: tRNA (uracil-5-)-methyltransferase Gid [Dehalococcoidia bacterium]|nr:tRNA (uracil-5-)-methyltransferase Gid [Dehalococcoidia bacterium]
MNRPRVVIVGAGFAGCGAAVAAAKAGAEVVLLERTDFVVASGIRAGVMNNNGKLVAAEEAKALGGGDIFEALESIVLHRGHIVDEDHAYVYNTVLVEPVVRRLLSDMGVDLRLQSRAVDVVREGGVIKAVVHSKGESVEGDAFVDCSGDTGGVKVCNEYGGGCAMCVTHRCPTFGDRVSIATKAGVPEYARHRPDGTPGTLQSAFTLHKSSLDPVLRDRLEKEGAISIPLPKEMIDHSLMYQIGGIRTARQMERLNLVDIGIAAKCIGNGAIPPGQLRSIPGLERAVIENPIAAGSGNKINGVSMAPREDTLRCRDFGNLFVAGVKAGPLGGITEAIVTGLVAGHNAVRAALKKTLWTLPRETTIGDFVSFTGEMMQSPQHRNRGYSMAHEAYFERMKREGLYTNDVASIHRRIRDLGLTGILARKLV